MLKFKEIRHSIVSKRDKKDEQAWNIPLSFHAHSPLMFRKNSNHLEISPLRKDHNQELKCETGKKPSLSPHNTAFCYSDFKENSTRNMPFTQTMTFGNLS